MARIVHLANFVGPRSGGLRTTMLRLAAGYARRGHEVHVIAPAGTGTRWPEKGPTVHELASVAIPGSGGYRLIAPSARVPGLLDALQPDVVELSDRLTLTTAAAWARRHGVPCAFFAHERVDGVVREHTRVLPGTFIADRMNRRLASLVDSVIATTAFAAEEFTRIGVPTTVVPLGVDAHQFVPRLHRPATDEVSLVACTRLSREKAPHLLLDVMALAVQLGRRWNLTVLGDGPLLTRLRRRASGLPITFTGFVNDRAALADALGNADAFLAPGPIETFGLAALEALSCATPVVCRAESALPEVVGPAGFAVTSDPAAWISAVDRIAHPARQALRQQARARSLQLPWDHTVSALLEHHGLASIPTPLDVAPAPLPAPASIAGLRAA